MRKILFLILIIFLPFIAFIVIINMPKNYKITYNIKDYQIEESYHKKDEIYTHIITYENQTFPFYTQSKYHKKRKLLKEIDIKTIDNTSCLKSNILSIDRYICNKEGTIVSIATLNNQEDFYPELISNDNKASKEYNKINIYDKEFKYYIWNYKGFYYIYNKIEENIKLLNKDNYKNALGYQTDRYLIVPDYNQEYFFQKIYVIDSKTNTLNDINFDDEISYDCYFLGYIKNKAYLYDYKNKVEYELDLKKNSIKIISDNKYGYIYNDNKLEQISLTKLNNNEIKFPNNQKFSYTVEDNNLYLNKEEIKIKISNNQIEKIIQIIDDNVFYLSKDKLYVYDYINSKERLLLEYNEWNFNYNNHIFIFN